MADIWILAAGPNTGAFYIWSGFSAIYTIVFPLMTNLIYDSYFVSSGTHQEAVLETIEKHRVVFLGQITDPDGMKTNLTSHAYTAVFFMGPLALWMILSIFTDGVFSNGMAFFGTLSWTGMTFWVWVASYIDDLIWLLSYSSSMWYLEDDASY